MHQAILQAAIDAAALVEHAYPDDLVDAAVTALISAKDIRWSQVCIFYCRYAYAKFYYRMTLHTQCIELDGERSQSRERRLNMPNGLREFGHTIIEVYEGAGLASLPDKSRLRRIGATVVVLSR